MASERTPRLKPGCSRLYLRRRLRRLAPPSASTNPFAAFFRISSKANSQSEAIQLAFLTFLPSIFFSGYIFPRETMPNIFYVISYFIPASYYINITRVIILRGAGLSHLWLDGVALYAMGSILLLIAARRFQNKVIMV